MLSFFHSIGRSKQFELLRAIRFVIYTPVGSDSTRHPHFAFNSSLLHHSPLIAHIPPSYTFSHNSFRSSSYPSVSPLHSSTPCHRSPLPSLPYNQSPTSNRFLTTPESFKLLVSQCPEHFIAANFHESTILCDHTAAVMLGEDASPWFNHVIKPPSHVLRAGAGKGE